MVPTQTQALMSTENPESATVAKADPGFRKKLFTGYALSILGMVGLYFLVTGPLRLLFLKADLMMRLAAMEVTAYLLLGVFIWPALYIIGEGKSVLSQGRYPHSGMKMIHDTVIQFGPKAARKGRLLILLGRVCITMVCLGAFAIAYLGYRFRTDPFWYLRG